jgi:hypothetical protein
MDDQELGWEGMNWIALAEDRDGWQAFVSNEPPGSRKQEFPD